MNEIVFKSAVELAQMIRDRFITQLDLELEPWDVWLVPVAATAAFTHRHAWSAVGR